MASTGVRFCSKCNNLLSPQEDKNERVLRLTCKICSETVEADNHVVYSHAVKRKEETKLEAVDGAVIYDPTLPRANNVKCAKCGNKQAVFFQGESGRDSDMQLVFVCTQARCRHKWLG